MNSDNTNPNAPLNMSDPATADLLLKTIEQVENDGAVSHSRELANRLGAILISDHDIPSDLRGKYEQVLVRARFLTFSIQSDETIGELLKNSLVQYLASGIDRINIADEVRKSFTRCIAPQDVAPFHEVLVTAIENNEENLGPLQLKNWLTDYVSFIRNKFAEKANHDAFERLSYVNESLNAKKLEKEEKELLLQLLYLYDKVKYDPISKPVDKDAMPLDERKIEQALHELFPEASAAPRPAVPMPAPVRVQPLPTLPPVELRDRSEEGRGGQRPEVQISNVKEQIKPKIQIPKIQIRTPQTPSLALPTKGEGMKRERMLPPAPRPRHLNTPPPSPSPQGGGKPEREFRIDQPGLNESLYRSSLDDLEKIRKQFERESTSPALPSLDSSRRGGRAPSPRQGREIPAVPPPAPRPPKKPVIKPVIASVSEAIPSEAGLPRRFASRNDGPSLSINDALINAGQKMSQVTNQGVSAGVEEKKPAVEERLKKLEEKIK